MQAKKIVLITSGQPSLNPRLVKEADALADAGFNVTVLYAYWNTWGTRFDNELLKIKKWKAIRAGGDPENGTFIFFLSRLLHKISVLITRKIRIVFFEDLAIARGSYFLIREARKHNADLYIGHNPGALPATIKAAKYHNRPCGFDAEDFHRNELSDDNANFDVVLKTAIENRYFPQVNYLSVSSPGIGQAYGELFKDKHPLTILNVFPVNREITAPKPVEQDNIKLFWFSQTISVLRGVNDCVESLRLIDRRGIELHLLGQADEGTKAKLINSAGPKMKLIFHDPVSPDEVIPFAHNFDIGLAMEESTPFNRDICLTNKIFSYMQAGLAIIASDTTAQAELMAGYPNAGKVYKRGDLNSMAQAILYYLDNPEDLSKTKMSSFAAGRNELNWEKESEKFIHLVKSTLAD